MTRGLFRIGVMGMMAALLGGLAGCAAQVDPAGAEAGLVVADAQVLTGQTLYLVDGIDRPLLLSEVEEGQRAIPVRVEIFESTAVAWYAPRGEAIFSRDTLVALWEVYEHVESPTPFGGDLADGTEAPVVVDSAREDDGPDLDTSTPGLDVTDLTVERDASHYILTDFEDRLMDPAIAELLLETLSRHPGCI